MLKKPFKFFTGLPDSKIFLLFFFSSCFLLLYLRSLIGVDIVDAPYHLMSMVHVLQGKVPLMQIWDGHTGFFMMAPFIALYKIFVPDLEGLEFYYRLLSLTIFIIISLLNIHLLNRKKYHDTKIFLYFIPLIFTQPVMRLQYNTLTALMILTAANLIYTESSYFFTGIITGLMCLSYPTCAFIAIFLFAYITFRHGIKKGLFFFAGAAIVGSAFFAWIFSKGSLQEFTTAMNYVINSPHTQNRGALNLKFFFRAMVVPAMYFCLSYIGIFTAYCFNLCLINRVSSGSMRSKVTLILYGIFAFLALTHYFENSHSRYILSLFITLIPFQLSMNKGIIKEHGIFYFLILIFSLVYMITSDNKNFLTGVYVITPVVVFVICLTLYEFCRENNIMRSLSILSMFLILAGLLHSYGNIYGEAGNVFGIGTFHTHALWKDSQIKKGTYKYLLTSEEKKNYLEQLQEFIKSNVYNNDKLCVITLESSVYSFTGAEIYTPWAFDAQYYWAGFRSSRPLLDYFEFYNEYPDVLVATNRVNHDFYDNPEYEINGFIKEHYVLSAQKTIENITAYIWRLKK